MLGQGRAGGLVSPLSVPGEHGIMGKGGMQKLRSMRPMPCSGWNIGLGKERPRFITDLQPLFFLRAVRIKVPE